MDVLWISDMELKEEVMESNCCVNSVNEQVSQRMLTYNMSKGWIIQIMMRSRCIMKLYIKSSLVSSLNIEACSRVKIG
jgi:hypothetical protein